MSLSPDHALIEANANTDAWREYYHQRINPLRTLLGSAVEFLEAAEWRDSESEVLARDLRQRIDAVLRTYDLSPEYREVIS